MASSQHADTRLFDSGVYTDLKIVCGNDQHQVHKAIVCLRSGRLAQLCSEIGPNQEATITIPDDDPQTIDLMLQYLYTLEYSPRIVAPTTAVPTPKPLTNGVNGHHQQKDDATPSPKTPTTNGGVATGVTNGSPQQQKPQPPTQTTLEYNIEREAFEAVPATESASKSSKKAAKKKKRSGTMTADALEAVSPTAATAPAVAVPEPASATKPTAPSSTTTTTANAAAQTHAKLYTLAQKYGVPGLRALSAARFAAEAEEYWSSDDFLSAAVEAYNGATPKTADMVATVAAAAVAAEDDEEAEEEKPRTIRDVVLGSMKAHPELLDRAAVREAIRLNAELSFDLMMFFRDNQQNGGSASSVVSMQSGVGTTKSAPQALLVADGHD
ncbi:hypothetical protein PG993_011974 [Apiospora rasikravindrae]|uniref:BTB domain-containing protein n=1 Tax=Apiospora rasikravindrae TaxID=990691 RepID=A0ABR1S189_9PEZI